MEQSKGRYVSGWAGRLSGKAAMKHILLCMMAIASTLVMAADRDQTMSGWVSDAACGVKHTQPGGADCVRKCLKGGQDIGHPEWTPQKMVFVADADKMVWVVTNPAALKGQEGLQVRITARVDAGKDSLRVVNVVSQEEAK
jgi:hypothetical protein